MDGGAAEDDVGDAFLANEARCGVGDAFAFDGEDFGVEVARGATEMVRANGSRRRNLDIIEVMENLCA